MIDGVTRRGSSPVFVGRRRELAQLDDAYGRGVSGQPSLVLVAGDAGIGKSRLIHEFSGRVEAADGIVIAGGCIDLGEGGLPYAPFVEGLRTLARSIHRDARAEAFGPVSDDLAMLVPDLRSGSGDDVGLSGVEAAGRRARLFDAVIEVLGRVSEDRPIALVLEDIHWADGSTRDLIRFLVRNIRGERVVIVATYRSDDLHRRHPLMPLLTELDRSERVERLQLDPFDRDELREQLVAILGDTPSDRFVDGLLERSDGLPFYVEELIAAEGSEPAGIPTTLRDILGYRLGALTGDVATLVGAASVIGGRFTEDRLAAVTDLEASRLGDALREAVAARILVQTTRDGHPALAFRHALLRETAYEELLPTARIPLHARLAEHLATEVRAGASDPAILADLAIHADLGLDPDRALTARIQASRSLSGAAAFQESLAHAERALELWSQAERPVAAAGMGHADLVAMTAQAAADASNPRRALDLYQLALAETEPDADLVVAARLLGDTWIVAFEAFEFKVVEGISNRMATIVDGLPTSSLKARVLDAIGSQHWVEGRYRQALEAYERSMAIAEDVHDDAEWVIGASSMSHALTDLVRGGRASELLDRLAMLSPGYDGSVIPFWALADRGEAMWGVGRFEDAVRLAAGGIEAARRYGVDERITPWITATDPLFELGRLDDVEAAVRKVNSSAFNEHPMLLAAATTSKVHIIRGELDAARTLLASRPRAAALGLVGGTGTEPVRWEPQDLPNPWDLEADLWLARAEADFDAARAAVESVRQRAPDDASDLVRVMMLGSGIGAAADESVRLRARRRRADADRVASIGLDWFQALVEIDRLAREDGGAGPLVDAVVAMAAAEHARMLGSPEPGRWQIAVERWDQIGQRYQGAYARLRFAEATLEAGGSRADVARSLAEAGEATRAVGGAPLLVEIDALAARAGIELESADPDGEDAPHGDRNAPLLTARERDVIRLVAAGHTNREIGDRLFISEKTVSVHVSHAMAKLGALSRYEAAAAAERQGLL